MQGRNDHEIYNGTDTVRFRLIRDENGAAMYNIQNFVPQYRNPLRFTQQDWIGGHGQHRFRIADKYFEGQSIDTTQEGRVFLGPLITEENEDNDSDLDGAPVCFCWYANISKLMCATATNIYRLDTEGWDVCTDTVTGVTHLAVHDDVLYACRGASTLYSYSTTGDTFTATDLTDGYANKIITAPNAAGTADVMWKYKTPNEVSNTTDGRTVAAGGVQWSTPNYIGDTTTNITNIFLVNDNLLIGREDGLWHLDSDGGLHPLRPDLEDNRSADNFKYVTEWQAGVYHSEIDGMGEITSYNAYEPMGALKDIDDIGRRGDTVGLAADKDWIYQAIKDATPYYYIYKGREVRKQGVLRWEWCPWIYMGSEATATLYTCQHSATDRRLWFGYGDSTAYVILSDNPTADSSYKFCASGWLRMSYDYGTEAEWDKLWQSAVLEVEGGATSTNSRKVEVKYRKDTDTGAGTSCIAAAETNGIFESNFTTGSLACERIQFQLNLTRTGTTTGTPEVSYFQAKGVEKPVTVRIHEATYVIGDEPTNRAKTLRDFFRTARTTTTLLKFADLRYGESTGGTAGTDYVYCVMEPGSPEQIEIIHRKDNSKELGIRVRLREVTAT